jgi:hypothetical protein
MLPIQFDRNFFLYGEMKVQRLWQPPLLDWRIVAMFKMFDTMIDKLDTLYQNTKLTIDYKFSGDSGPSKYSLTTHACDQENMSKVYNSFKKFYELDYKTEARFLEHRLKTKNNYRPFNLLATLTISGKLNGHSVNEKFTDLESFRKYLEDNLLIPKTTLELKPA